MRERERKKVRKGQGREREREKVKSFHHPFLARMKSVRISVRLKRSVREREGGRQ